MKTETASYMNLLYSAVPILIQNTIIIIPYV